MSVYLEAAKKTAAGDWSAAYQMSRHEFEALNLFSIDNPDLWNMTIPSVAVMMLLFAHEMHKTGDL